MRAAVGVSVRWEFLLPPTLLQPRVSPMGCNGIKYLPMRGGVQKHVVFSSWHPSIDPVLPTSAEKESRVVLSLCPQQKLKWKEKRKKSIRVVLGGRLEEKCEKSSLCCLQAVQTQVWGTPSQSVHSYSPEWKVGGKEQREPDGEGERVCE